MANDRLIQMQARLTPAGAKHLANGPGPEDEIEEITTPGTAATLTVNEVEQKKKRARFEDAEQDTTAKTAEVLKAEISERNHTLNALTHPTTDTTGGGGLGRGGRNSRRWGR
eukprot:1632216-Rhodomonas_salina.1